VSRGFRLTLFLSITLPTLLLAKPVGLNAQKTLPDGPAVGATVDRFIYEDQGITAVSFRFSGLRSRTLGSEIGVSLFPDALSAGAIYLAPDVGAAFNIPGPGLSVLMKGGLSTLAALGGGFTFIPGYHLGGGLIVQAGERWGFRVDAARHVYLIEQAGEVFWSLGVGFTGLARRRVVAP
jgi:hypothetical protein